MRGWSLAAMLIQIAVLTKSNSNLSNQIATSLKLRDQNSPVRDAKQWDGFLNSESEMLSEDEGKAPTGAALSLPHTITRLENPMDNPLDSPVAATRPARYCNGSKRESFHSPETDYVDTTQQSAPRYTLQRSSQRREKTMKPHKRRKSRRNSSPNAFAGLDMEYHPKRSTGVLLEEPSSATRKSKERKEKKKEEKRHTKIGSRSTKTEDDPRESVDYILPNRHGRANSLYVSTMASLQLPIPADAVSHAEIRRSWRGIVLPLDKELPNNTHSLLFVEFLLKDLLRILQVAASLRLVNVVNKCISILKYSLTPSNCSAVLAVADHFHVLCSDLFDATLRYIEDNFQCVGDSEDFCYLTLKHILMILRRDRLAVKYESDIFRFAKEWLKVNLVGSKWTLLYSLCPVLSCIRTNSDNQTWVRTLKDWKPTATNLFASLTDQAGAGDPWGHGIWFGHNRVPTKKVLLAIGGVISEDTTSLGVEYLTLAGHEGSTEGWQAYPVENFPERNLADSRYAVSVVTVNNEVYAIGGAQDIPNSFYVLSSIERYDVVSSSWSTDDLPQMNYAVSAAGVAVLDGWIYVVGGCDSSGHFVARVSRYHPALKVWQDRAPLSVRRSRIALCAYEGALYAFGGCQVLDTPSKMVERYNPQENMWERMPDMNYPTDDAASCIVGHHFYLFGGGGDRSDRASCARFSFRKRNWFYPKSMKRVRAGAAAVAVNGVIYVVGGSPDRKTYHTSVEIYDPATETWTDGPDLNYPRHMLGLAVVSVDDSNSGLSFPAVSFVPEEEDPTECVTLE